MSTPSRTTSMTAADRVFNFSAGPAVLPLPVLEAAQRDLLCLPGAGASILEISHRGGPFRAVLAEAVERLSRLLALPPDYHILFLQGGSRLQFSMVPMNLLRGVDGAADYVLTGSWGNKALAEAEKEGNVHVAWDGGPGYDRLPSPGEPSFSARPAYVHVTSNETIQGVQFPDDPSWDVSAPLVCDMSSDFLCRPIDVARYGLIYACAQKNAGPAGVTIVVIRDDLLARSRETLPGYLNYREQVAEGSLYNTPPCFGIYVVNLVAQWLEEEMGGLAAIWEVNRRKAARLYEVIDSSEGFYEPHARPDSRSQMNVTFRLPNDALQAAFLEGAAQQSLEGLKGHRSVGGIRASIYNAMPEEGVASLAQFMADFHAQHG